MKSDEQVEVIAPLFDRLTDNEPDVPSEPRPFRSLTVPQLKDSIKKEVSTILNTRECRIPFGIRAIRDEEELPSDILEYGLPDFSKFDATNSTGRNQITKHIENILPIYEPRLDQVKAEVLQYDKKNQTLTVSITGHITVIPLPERFTFPVKIEKFGD